MSSFNSFGTSTSATVLECLIQTDDRHTIQRAEAAFCSNQVYTLSCTAWKDRDHHNHPGVLFPASYLIWKNTACARLREPRRSWALFRLLKFYCDLCKRGNTKPCRNCFFYCQWTALHWSSWMWHRVHQQMHLGFAIFSARQQMSSLQVPGGLLELRAPGLPPLSEMSREQDRAH